MSKPGDRRSFNTLQDLLKMAKGLQERKTIEWENDGKIGNKNK